MAHVVPVFTTKKIEGEITLPSGMIEEGSLTGVAQAVRVYASNRHSGLPKVKSRGEVALTTKKMYRQKHTGNARHGAASAPIFVGGGVTHGPRGVRRVLYLSNVLKKSALKTALNAKYVSKKIGGIKVDSLTKTKDAAQTLALTGSKTVLVALTTQNWGKAKVFRNIEGVTVTTINALNAYEVLSSQFVLLDASNFEKKETKAAVKVAKKPAKKVTKTK